VRKWRKRVIRDLGKRFTTHQMERLHEVGAPNGSMGRLTKTNNDRGTKPTDTILGGRKEEQVGGSGLVRGLHAVADVTEGHEKGMRR